MAVNSAGDTSSKRRKAVLFEFEFSVALRSQRPYGLLGTGSPGVSTSSFKLLLSSICSRSRSAALLLLPNSSSVLLYVHRDHKDYQGRGAQDGHLDFHTAPELGNRRKRGRGKRKTRGLPQHGFDGPVSEQHVQRQVGWEGQDEPGREEIGQARRALQRALRLVRRVT